MGDHSKIEWTDATWNPLRARFKSNPGLLIRDRIGWHCEHVSEGCRNCYAEGFNKRLGTGLDFKPGHRVDIEIFLDEKMLLAPLRWKRPRMVFVCSMTDAFAEFVKDEWLDRMFAVMALCPQHTFQVLTKRAQRMREYLNKIEDEPHLETVKRFAAAMPNPMPAFGEITFPLPNVWLGVSCEDQANADERIPALLQTPAAVRFISAEPLLGPITLWAMDEDEGALRGPGVVISGGVTPSTPDNPPEGYDDSYPGVDWVIVGGESGPNARPMMIQWVRGLRDQCAAADVPLFFKQWGAYRPDDPTANRTSMVRVGKKAAGRLLDGKEHSAMPERA